MERNQSSGGEGRAKEEKLMKRSSGCGGEAQEEQEQPESMRWRRSSGGARGVQEEEEQRSQLKLLTVQSEGSKVHCSLLVLWLRELASSLSIRLVERPVYVLTVPIQSRHRDFV